MMVRPWLLLGTGLALALLVTWALVGNGWPSWGTANDRSPASGAQQTPAPSSPELLHARECFYQAQMQINLVEAEMTQPLYDHDTSEAAARAARRAADRLRLVAVTPEGHWLLESAQQFVLYDPERRDFLTEGYAGCGATAD